MFGIGKKIEQDPKNTLENADKVLNIRASGFLAKPFMGKDFVSEHNQAMDMAKGVLNLQKSQQNLLQYGLPATAEVIAVEDTGLLIKFDPVVKMQLRVQPQFEAPFEALVQTMVSKIIIPSAGDTVNIKYNPGDLTQIIVI